MKAVVLAGDHDSGLCRLAARVPKGLWPIVERPLIQHVVRRLLDEGVQELAICANGNGRLYSRAIDAAALEPGRVRLYEDRLPRGPAGCVADALSLIGQDSCLVVQSNVLFTQSVAELAEVHRRSGADLTVALQPTSNGQQLKPAGIYLLEPCALNYVRPRSYQDIKEQLIPAMARAGRRIATVVLKGQYLECWDAGSYLDMVESVLSQAACFAALPERLREAGRSVYVAADAAVDRTARLVGPIAILSGAEISAGAVLVGPVVVGADSRIGRSAVVSRSILWPQAHVGAGAFVSQSVLTSHAIVKPGQSVELQVVLPPGPATQELVLPTDGGAAVVGAPSAEEALYRAR